MDSVGAVADAASFVASCSSDAFWGSELKACLYSLYGQVLRFQHKLYSLGQRFRGEGFLKPGYTLAVKQLSCVTTERVSSDQDHLDIRIAG